jgi:radical SAM superfamily enzyme YgiQ (UPF0313 family)
MELTIVGIPNYGDPFTADWLVDLRYSVGFLRRQRCRVSFLYPAMFNDFDRLVAAVAAVGSRAVFFDLNEENCDTAIALIKKVRRAIPRALILAGGIVPSTDAARFLRRHREIDYIVRGERERVLLVVLRRLRRGRSALKAVAGLTGRRFSNPPQPALADLDKLGPLATDGLAELLQGQSRPAGYIMTSRGCYGNCSFCGIPTLYRQSPGPAWRGRSVKAIVNELQSLNRRFGLKDFVFQDDNFSAPGPAGRRRARELAGEILRRRLKIRFYLCCRLNDLEPAALRLLKRSGLSGLCLSIESLNQRSLDLFNKGLKVTMIRPILDLLEKIGRAHV